MCLIIKRWRLILPEVVTLFDSDKEGRTQEERPKNKWLTRYKNSKSSTAFIGNLVGHDDKEDFALEDLFPEYYYLKKFQESHKKEIKIMSVDDSRVYQTVPSSCIT